MIDKITFSNDDFSHEYNKDTMQSFFKNKYPKHRYLFNKHSSIKWISYEKEYQISEPQLQHYVTPEWDGIVLIHERLSMQILNSDASQRFEIHLPENLIQLTDYQSHVDPRLFNQIKSYDSFKMEFQRFDGYHEINGKTYIGIQISKLMKNAPPYGLAQIRYLDTDSGEFLPFTKDLSYFDPNPHGYNEFKISL